jgi:2'-hydroxyisoflavone reductase
MKLLVMGGTVFLGRHVVEAALARGHEVTMFNRGRHDADAFPQAERLRGDRDGDLSALRDRRFDAVIDTCGYTPAQLRSTADALGAPPAHYVFVSTISVYRAFPPHRPFDEQAPVTEGEDGYGALKARAEEAIESAFPGGVAHVRPGLIVGPHDPTGRFTYWPRRMATGGDVLAPGRPGRPVQLIDARDLAQWCVHLAESRTAGVFNATGPAGALTMADLLHACRDVAASDARLCWVPDEGLLQQGVAPWTGLPLWIPENDAQFGGMLLADNRRAIAAGLKFRPLDDTIRATLAWERARQARDGAPSAGVAVLDAAGEQAVLAQAGRTTAP